MTTEQVTGVKRALEEADVDNADNTKSAALEKLRAENKDNEFKKSVLLSTCQGIDALVEQANTKYKKAKEELDELKYEQRTAHDGIKEQKDGLYTKIRALNVLEELAVTKEGHVVIVDDFDQMLAACINDFFLEQENEFVTKHRGVFEMIRARFDYALCLVTVTFKTKRYANRDSERDWYDVPEVDIDVPCCGTSAIITDMDYEEMLECNSATDTDGDSDGMRDIMVLRYSATHLALRDARKTEVE
jgi:hypothetical protein